MTAAVCPPSMFTLDLAVANLAEGYATRAHTRALIVADGWPVPSDTALDAAVRAFGSDGYERALEGLVSQ